MLSLAVKSSPYWRATMAKTFNNGDKGGTHKVLNTERDYKARRRFWGCYMLLIIIVLWLSLGCAHVYLPPEKIIIDVPVEVYLYDSVADLRDACMVEGWNADCSILLGIYRNNNKQGLHSLHCIKWDFESCGHELYHALQRTGTPTLSADGRNHFEMGGDK